MSTSEDVVAKWVVEHNKGIKVTDQQAQSLKEAGMVILLYGKNIVFAKDNTIDWQKTMQNMIKSNSEMKQSSGETWNYIEMLLKNNIITVQQAEDWIKLLGETGVVSAEEMKEKLDDYTKSLEDTKSPLEDFFKKQQEIGQAAQEGSQKLLDEADSLGILNETVGMSTEQIEQAIELKKSENKEHDKTISSLQSLALARGADLDVVKQSIPELSAFIQTHRLEKVSKDEIAATTAELTAAREEDMRATALEEAAARELLATSKEGIPVTEMTGKGLMDLIDIYTDTANATRLAADEVGVWYAELQQGEAQETATIAKLEELAEKLGITIPDYIREDGVPAIQEWIEATLGIGEGAKKAAEDAKKAFEDITNSANQQLEGIISDKLGEDSDNIKKALKGLQKLNVDLNSITGVEHIVSIFLNDKDFENDIKSLGDIMLEETGRLKGFGQSEGTEIGDKFVTGIIDQVGKKSPATAAAVDLIWEKIKASAKPEDTGDDLIGRLGDALNKPEILQAAIDEVGQSGINEPLEGIFGESVQIADKNGKLIPEATAKGITQNATLVTDAAGNLVVQAGGQMQLIENEATTATAPVPGIFSQAFLDASTHAGTQLSTMVTDIHTKMSTMSTSVATYSNSMNVNFVTAIQNMGIPLLPFGTAITTLQTTMSLFSTSVA